MANWSSGGEAKRIGIAEMLSPNICIVYVTGYHRDVPTRKFEQGRPKGAPVVIEGKDQLHCDIILIDSRSGQAFEHRDQTMRSWALIKVARDSVGKDPLLGTFVSQNGQANNASWQPLTGDARALELAGTWLESKGPEGWVRSPAREPEVHTAPPVPAYQPAYQPAPGQQGYHGWPQDATPAPQPAYQQQPPSWAPQQPQQPPAYQPAPQPQYQQAPPTYQPAPEPVVQQQYQQPAPQGFAPQQPAQGYQQAPQQQVPQQPAQDQYQQWAQAQQQQPRYDQRMEAYQEQRPVPQPQQTSLQQMVASGAIAPPPVAGQPGSGYAGGPEQPPF